MDRRYLLMIADIYKGGPVGVETLAAGLAEPRDTIEEVIEPFLIQLGLVARTARGRCLNDRAWEHLDRAPSAPIRLQTPESPQSGLVRRRKINAGRKVRRLNGSRTGQVGPSPEFQAIFFRSDLSFS